MIKNKEILFKDIDGNIIKSKINIGTDIENCDLIILCVKSYDAQILIQKLSSLIVHNIAMPKWFEDYELCFKEYR